MHSLRVTVFSLLALVLLAATPAVARPLVAVLDFSESRTNLHVDEMSVLGDVARGVALRALGHDYDVITRENLVDLLKSHGKTLDKCSGECETETGRLLGAELVVSGRIVKAFGKFKVNLKVHRTDPPALLGAEMMSAKTLADLEEAVRLGTSQLLAAVPGSRSRAGSAPAATVASAPAPAPSRAAAAPAAVTESAATPSAVASATRTEWWSVALTNGAFDSDDYTVGLSATGPLLRWPYFYWQSIRASYTAIEGDVDDWSSSFSTSLGYRTSLGADGRSELRIGGGYGVLLAEVIGYDESKNYDSQMYTVEVAFSMPYDETKSWEFVLEGLFPLDYGSQDCTGASATCYGDTWYIDPTYLLHTGIGF